MEERKAQIEGDIQNRQEEARQKKLQQARQERKEDYSLNSKRVVARNQESLQKYGESNANHKKTKEQVLKHFKEFVAHKKMQTVFTDNLKGLKLTYKQVCKLDNNLAGVSQAAFTKFSTKANIIPKIISSKDVVYAFQSELRDKKERVANFKAQNGDIPNRAGKKAKPDEVGEEHLGYKDFKNALVKIAVLGQEKLGVDLNKKKKGAANFPPEFKEYNISSMDEAVVKILFEQINIADGSLTKLNQQR